MERKLIRKGSGVREVGSKWQSKVCKNNEKYHMRNQYDVVSYIIEVIHTAFL